MTVRRSVGGLALLIATASGLAACGGSDDSDRTVTTVSSRQTEVAGSNAAPSTAGSIDTPATATSRAEPSTEPGSSAPPSPERILLFSRTTGFRHGSIGAATDAIEALAVDHGFSVVVTDDPGAFTGASLAGFDAVVFLMTTGDVLDHSQQAALEAYIEDGGGFAGVHAAADTEYDWPWYGELVGAWFAAHPAVQPATVTVEDRAHPSTTGLPATWVATDEWYDFRRNVRGHARVLLTVDEATYEGGSMGADHPIAWCRDVGEGRSWYTGLGHTDEQWSTPELRAHVLGGLLSVAGRIAADCTP